MENYFKQSFQNDFNHKSLRKLKEIRHHYFADKFKYLLNLLLLYFEKKTSANAKKGHREFILCRNYNIVFEDMIDKLISDEPENLGNLKNQSDGKIVDHIFLFESLFKSGEIYYIGDSKYYKDTTNYSPNAIYKQHTYAKNIIQYNINLFNRNDLLPYIRYRDNLTEGYSITPNFFIQGFINHKNLTDKADEFQFDSSQPPKINYQFENRIFDRDTLIILSFKVNFLFVINSYIVNDRKKTVTFRANAKKEIRGFAVEYFNKNYEFYEIEPDCNLEKFVNENFKMLVGKIYRNNDTSNNLILGLSKKHPSENNKIKQKIKSRICKKINLL